MVLSNGILECKFCNQIHKIGIGFPQNDLANAPLKAKPKEVYRGKAAEALKAKLASIRTEIEALELALSSGEAKINEYCDSLRF